MIERRVAAAVDGLESLRGEVADIRVCLPCGSYTLEGVEFRPRARPPAAAGPGTGPDRPLFSARRVVVSVSPLGLLDGGPGRVHLDEPYLRIRTGGGSGSTPFDVPWDAIGSALLPVPIARLSADAGRIELSNPNLEPPVRWLIREVGLESSHLTAGGGEPPVLWAEGRAPGDGRIEARLRLPGGGPADRARAFQLEARVRDVPLVELNDYARNALRLDLEGGTADADLRLTGGADGGVRGRLDCRFRELDVLDLRDAWPHEWVWEALAAAAVGSASTPEETLELQIDFAERLEGSAWDAWSAVGLLLRRSLLRLLESPASSLRWLAEAGPRPL